MNKLHITLLFTFLLSCIAIPIKANAQVLHTYADSSKVWCPILPLPYGIERNYKKNELQIRYKPRYFIEFITDSKNYQCYFEGYHKEYEKDVYSCDVNGNGYLYYFFLQEGETVDGVPFFHISAIEESCYRNNDYFIDNLIYEGSSIGIFY